MAKKILILGAGAGGSMAANKIARELRREIAKGEVEITLLDKDNTNINQAGYTFLPFGFLTQEDLVRSRKSLISPRVKCAFGEDGEVTHVDLKDRVVTAKKPGKKYEYDYLLIAMGCEFDINFVPGLANDFNSFYPSIKHAYALRDKINNLNGGNIVIYAPKLPVQCPGAPPKFAVFLDDYLRYVKRTRDKFKITFLWADPSKCPSFKYKVMENFVERGVEMGTGGVGFKSSEVNAERKEVIIDGKDRIKYDLLVTIPPHKGTKVLIDSGITGDDTWIPSDKNTLQYRKSSSESYDEVYCIGNAGPADILKTGIGAHYQALVTAQNIINDVKGAGRVLYRGETGCPYIESSYTTATRGKAYLPTWTYDNPPRNFEATEMGWFIYRMYYYMYWDTAIKALM